MDHAPQSRADEAFSSVTREDVLQALSDLDRGVEHPFGPSSTYDLVYEGRRYPPKAVIALAVKAHSGVNLVPADFPGGEGTAAFHALRSLEFEIVPKQTSDDDSVKFERSDCEVFDRYPNSVAWADVSKPDQERFKSIRSRLKQIAQRGAQSKGTVVLHAATSLATPNGRSPKEIWCCVYPGAARNKSYAFQVAFILSQRGGELCFCLGAGTSQIQDAAEKRELMQGFHRAKAKLRSIPGATVSAVEQRLGARWFYRESWLRIEPIHSEFDSLSAWLEYATRDEVTAASVSTYMTPEQLEGAGDGIEKRFFDAVDIFRPLLDFPFSTSGFWIFQGNPARFDIDTYLRNRSKITWSVNQYEKDVHAGDRVLMWRSGVNGGVVAECQITDGPSAAIAEDAAELRNPNAPLPKPGNLRCKLRVINAFPDNVLPRQLIQSNLPELPIFRFAQNTNFPISANDYESILILKAGDSIIQSRKTKELPPQNLHYSIEDLANETGFTLETLERWTRALERKGQAIFYGPPGTGKTFIAEKLSKHIVSDTDGLVELVQFHPAYSYEDFMQGIRPVTEAGGGLSYIMASGRFIEFCDESAKRKSPCVLIIDEINRANLSRVFGELMYLLEYRNRRIPLAGGRTLEIPDNIRLLGTMNTADRSIALVDHALRRRFTFIALRPEYEILRQYQQQKGFDAGRLIQQLKIVNNAIDDPHYAVGITFFLRENLASELADIWQMEIEPYLEEFFFDQPQKFEQLRWEKLGHQMMP